MKFKTGYETKKARVEMLPLIDVVFLLLVFFIYAMVSMVVHHGLNINLPEAGLAQADSREFISITITPENQLFLGETPTELDQLVPLVTQELNKKGAETPIYIEGDQTAHLGMAITILDRLQKAGIEKISFSCTPPSQN